MTQVVAAQRALNAEEINELISRRVKAREKHRGIRPENAQAGQVWVVAPPSPIYDTCTGETIAVHVFLMEPAADPEMVDWWYGFLTQRKEPNLERPLSRWEFNPYMDMPYMDMAVDAFHRDTDWLREEADPEADYLLHEAPIFIHKDQLRYCVANFGEESVPCVQEHSGWWFSTGGPGTAMDRSTQIGGHDFMEIVAQITGAYTQALEELA